MRLLADNWLLGSVRDALDFGLLDQPQRMLVMGTETDSHEWCPVPFAGIQLESVISLILQVVLADELLVATGYQDVWDTEALISLEKLGILKEIQIDIPSDPVGRNAILNEICRVSELRNTLNENAAALNRGDSMPYPEENLLIWGAAGYLLRSGQEGIPYSGHPSRKALIAQADFEWEAPCPSALRHFNRWMSKVKAGLRNSILDAYERAPSEILLPPIAVQVIEDCRDARDLIPVALQFRERYAPLRAWLSRWQSLLDRKDAKRLLAHQRELDSMAKSFTDSKYGTITFNLGFLTIQLPLPRNPVSMIKNRIGIRSHLDGQFFADAGVHTIRTLLRLFDEGDSALGRRSSEYLQERYSA